MKLCLKEKNGDWKLFKNVIPFDLESRNIKIGHGASVGECASVGNGARVGDGASVGDSASVGECARVGNSARVEKTIDCIVLGPIGSRESMLTGFLREKEIWIGTGCFNGPIEKFRTAVKEKHSGTRFERDYMSALTYIESRLNMARES